MNILLFALGSHGDVHPFVGIGIRLRERGHNVAIAANGYFKDLVDHAKLEFFPVGTAEEYVTLATNPNLWHPSRGPKTVFQATAKFLQPQYDIAAEFAKRGDVRMVASSLALGARVAQDKFGFPLASAHIQPGVFQSSIAPPRLTAINMFPNWMPMWLRRMNWRLINKVMDGLIAPALNEVRGKAGLPPVKRILESYWHSPDRVIGLFPEWYAPVQPDWPKQTVLTGFPLFDEPDLSPISPELEAFLQAGEPPIAFTPGSAMWQGRAFFEASAQACAKSGRRGILLTRHRDHLPPTLPPGVIHVHFAPFSKLMPRCAAVVHHGGIGSSAQGLARGVPQLITPFTHDQPDNADRLTKLGVARTLPPRRYTPDRIAEELKLLIESPDVRNACLAVANRFEGVDALTAACQAIESTTHDGSTVSHARLNRATVHPTAS